ncbi:MAG: hypothetical protein ABMB14_13745 [Myxococcota bacterium]
MAIDAGREARSRLQELARAVGNDEIAKRIASGNATRDQMLAFVAERLGVVRELQLREDQLTEKQASYAWWREASESQRPNTTEPEPTRWHGTARAYELAVRALCAGDVRQGAVLLDEAIRLEQQTTDGLTDLVDPADAEHDAALDTGFLAGLAAATPACGAVAEPPPIRALLDDILRVQTTVPEAPTRRHPRAPWWTTDEDDEGEPDGAGGG